MESVSCKWLLLSFLFISWAHSALCAVNGVKGGKVRGVNLGGWLVVEGWMKPSLFDGLPKGGLQGEYQLSKGHGPKKAKQVLTEHRNTFVTRDDFQFLSQHNINTVRIPVGWWITKDPNPPAPYVGGSLAALDNAFTWAKETGIKCIIDLHAAPGSQNGKDHSSSRDGSIEWAKSENIQQSLEAIEFLASKYVSDPALLGIELLNEPNITKVSPGILMKYYKDGYDIVRKHSDTAYVIMCQMVGEGFENAGVYQSIAKMGLSNVVVDFHYYNLYNDFFSNKSVKENIDYIRNERKRRIESRNAPNGPLVFIGEWVNEFGKGGWSQTEYQEYGSAQLDVYGSASFGWAYWSIKNDAAKHWDLMWNIDNNYLQL
ncbi:hypothetical protein MKX01_005300 [Papaver californicum]|nr:hypothetical protein MKX01_005300 [Papaver californicum]